VVVTGEQREDRDPHVHERIEILQELIGPELDTEAARRSIEASATRYCTLRAMFSAGPDENPDALGTRYRSPADLPAQEGLA
jgi:uncharacterized OsmC-like protein